MFWHHERALGWPSIAFYHSLSLFGRIRSVFFSFYQFILTNQHAVTLRPMRPQSWWIIEGCIRDNMASWSWWWDAHRIWQQTMWFVLHCFHHQFLMTCTACVHHSRNVDRMAEISVRRSSSLDWKKDRNRTEPNCKRPDHRLRLHKFWIFSVASCDVCQEIEKPKKPGLDRLQPVFCHVMCWTLLTHLFP